MLAAIIAVIIVPALIWGFLLYQAIRFRRRIQGPLPPIIVPPPLVRVRALLNKYGIARLSGAGGYENRPAETPAAGVTDRDIPAIVEQRSVWDLLRFISGPLPLSIVLHIAILLAILWGV